MFSLIDMLGTASPVIDIVDVGALWMGQQQVVYRKLLKPGYARVVGFEPVKEECEKLNKMGHRDHRYLPYFIGDGSEREFRLNNFAATSSLYEPNRRLVDRFNALGEVMVPQKREKVSTTRLDDIPEIRRVDYIKLDIQGAELDALRGGERLLKDCVVIHTEVEFVPLYENQPLFAEVDQELRRQGFLIHAIPGLAGRPFKPLVLNNDANRYLNQVLWADVTYVKDFTRLAMLDSEQLIRMAVILHEVYESFDLAALCFQHYDAKMKTKLWGVYMQRLLGGAKPPEPPPLD